MPIPALEPGLVVHLNYLWSREKAHGLEEARYARPCVVVLSYRRGLDGSLMALLAPITHSSPRAEDVAIDMPPRVKAQLGLDSERSWIVVSEVNETGWPGFDLQPNASGRYDYGLIPPVLFDRVKRALIDVVRSGRLSRVHR